MAYYYVKDGGTATGDAGRYASQQTGSFATIGASGYYDTIEDACNATTAPVAGDIICVSDTHNKTYSPSANIQQTGGGTTQPIMIWISVDDTDVTVYKPGAAEDVSATDYDYVQFGNSAIYGIDLTGNDITVDYGGSNAYHILQDCTIKTGNGSGDICIDNASDGSTVHMYNVWLDCVSGGLTNFGLNCNPGDLYWIGGGVITEFSELFDDIGSAGGSRCELIGLDLSVQTEIMGTTGGVIDDSFSLYIKNCKLATDVVFATSLDKTSHMITVENSDDATSGRYHRLEYHTGSGSAVLNDSIYVTSMPAWYGGSSSPQLRSSIEVYTTANVVDPGRPFIFKIPAQLIDLSQAASDKVTLHLMTDNVTLTNMDIHGVLVYPDGTTPVTPRVKATPPTTTGNWSRDPWASGTELSTTGALGASDWTGEDTLGTPKYYVMEFDTSGTAGSKTVVEIELYVYKASIASGDLFIHPILSVS